MSQREKYMYALNIILTQFVCFKSEILLIYLVLYGVYIFNSHNAKAIELMALL